MSLFRSKAEACGNSDHHLAKGVIYLAIAYAIYLLSGYIVHFGLVRMISPAEYGVFGVILSILDIVSVLIMNGVPRAASKYLSEGVDGYELRRKALKSQLLIAIVLAVFVLAAAPTIANMLSDGNLTIYVRSISVIILLRGVNQLYGGFFNGYREFGKQAAMVVLNALPRVLLTFLLVYMSFGIFGALGGYASSLVIGLLFGMCFSRPRTGRESISYRKIVTFSYPVVLFSVFFRLIAASDLLLVKSIIGSPSHIGFYNSARVVSTVFTVSVAFSTALLPSISRSFSRGDILQTERYIRDSLRYTFMFFCPLAFIISSESKELLSLLFTSEYSKCADALSILTFGWFFLWMFHMVAYIINASGRSKIPALISGVCVPLAFGGSYLLVKHYGVNGGAVTVLIVGILCFVSGIYYTHRIYKASIDIISTARILAASVIIYLISSLLTVGGTALIIWSISLFLLYFGVLFLIREIDREDIRLVKDIAYSLTQRRSDNLRRCHNG